jgi:hypothetical protein
MAQICPKCGSADTQSLVRSIQCLNSECQTLTSYAKLAETPQPTHRREPS